MWKKANMVACIFNPSSGQVEAGRSLELTSHPVWASRCVQCQWEILSRHLRIDSQGCLLTATYTQAWAPAHTWTYMSLETHAKQFEFDDCIRCVLTGILFWSGPLINVHCLFTTWPQTYRSNDTSQWPSIKLLCISFNIFATCSMCASVSGHYGLYKALEFHSCQCRHF